MKSEKAKSRHKESSKEIIKKCHSCGHLTVSVKEPERCGECRKSFLPSRYFEKVHHNKNMKEYQRLFSHASEMNEDDLVKGLNVLW